MTFSIDVMFGDSMLNTVQPLKPISCTCANISTVWSWYRDKKACDSPAQLPWFLSQVLEEGLCSHVQQLSTIWLPMPRSSADFVSPNCWCLGVKKMLTMSQECLDRNIPWAKVKDLNFKLYESLFSQFNQFPSASFVCQSCPIRAGLHTSNKIRRASMKHAHEDSTSNAQKPDLHIR